MIELVLIGLLVLTAATLYIASQIKSVLLFDRICNAFLVFTSLQALFALVSIYAGGNYTFMAVPFFLVYGPFKYYAVSSRVNSMFLRKTVYVHFIPSFIFCLVYFIINEFSLLSEYLPIYNTVLFLSVFVSMTAYSVWVLFNNSKAKYERGNDPLARRLLNFSSVFIIVVSAVSSVYLIKGFLYTGKFNPIIFSSIFYLLALFLVAVVFRYKVYSFIAYIRLANEDLNREKIKKEENELPENLSLQPEFMSNNVIDINRGNQDSNNNSVVSLKTSPKKYAKSALNEGMFEVYEEKLHHFFNDEKVYLDNDISLEVLAEKMKLSKHHLTQLFNVYIGENFNQYINKYRISYSCGLLQSNEDEMTMEEVAFESGFNSKVSFNRHFKNIMGCTPSDYTKKAGVA